MTRNYRVGVSVAVLGLILGLAILIYRNRQGAPQRAALTARGIAAQVLGETIRGNAQPEEILVVSNPFTQEQGLAANILAYETAGLEGLRRGLEATASLRIVYPELREAARRNRASVHVDPQTTTPLSYLIREDAFDRLAEQNPGSKVLVSLIGLPLRLARQPVWTQPGTPRFALLLPDWRPLGDRRTVRDAVRSGKILAAVLRKPGAPTATEALSDNYRQEFDRLFLLLTADTVDRIMADYPQLFP